MFTLLAIKILLFTLCLPLFVSSAKETEFCEKADEFEETNECNIRSRYSQDRYILYDVNPPEGFNLRRDVYIRVAVFVRTLQERDKKFKWHLVLPPWGNLYHWRSRNIGTQAQLPWALFFDVTSLKKYAPVMEMHQFLKEFPSESGQTRLDTVYILQNDEEMFKIGKFEDKNLVAECTDSPQYYKLHSGGYKGYFWGYNNITARFLKCVTFHGMMSDIEQNLQPNIHRAVMFDHMEIPLHDYYGSREYWRARRSMRYNLELYNIANEYREKILNSADGRDNTERPKDWTQEKERRNAIGGPYLSVHLRRRDFLSGRSDSIPTIQYAALQIEKKLKELNLNTVFIATDTTEQEFDELRKHLGNFKVVKFTPSDYVLKKFKDGGVAIVDQIICSYARYFIGTHESTFTFRIQEDREIIGFPPETTFNRLCKAKEKCSSSGDWKIVW